MSNRPKVLGIQFRRNEYSVAQEQECLRREMGAHATVDFVSALDEAAEWGNPAVLLWGYAGIVLGGSGEFDFDGGRDSADPHRAISYVFLERLRPLFEYMFAHDVPTFGICYGHQIIGAFSGAQVVNDHAQKKSCSHGVRLLVDANDYFLFSGLPEQFLAHYGHKDSLDRIPEGATLLMNGGEQCRVSALQYQRNIFTTQFHPELTLADMVERLKSSPGYLPEGVAVEEIFKDDPHSNKILHNFAKFVALRAEGSTSRAVPI